jgi:hypothetical protein
MISVNSANGSCILPAKSGSTVTALRCYIEEFKQARQFFGPVLKRLMKGTSFDVQPARYPRTMRDIPGAMSFSGGD